MPKRKKDNGPLAGVFRTCEWMMNSPNRKLPRLREVESLVDGVQRQFQPI